MLVDQRGIDVDLRASLSEAFAPAARLKDCPQLIIAKRPFENLQLVKRAFEKIQPKAGSRRPMYSLPVRSNPVPFGIVRTGFPSMYKKPVRMPPTTREVGSLTATKCH